jgi:conjugal transfer pilus assembly protein TraV
VQTHTKIFQHSCIVFLLLFQACAPLQDAINPYEENFKCKTKDDAGECIDTPTAYKNARYPEPESSAEQDVVDETKQIIQDNRYKILTDLLEEPERPMLKPPKILRVLLLPYKGEDDELFMTRYVYLKIEDSKWILTDLNEK